MFQKSIQGRTPKNAIDGIGTKFHEPLTRTKQNKTKGKGNVVHHKWPKDNKDSGTVTDRQAGGGGRSVATVLEQEEAVRLAVPRRTGGNIKEKLVKGKRNQN